jgi:hypothetical protein
MIPVFYLVRGICRLLWRNRWALWFSWLIQSGLYDAYQAGKQ